MTDYLIELSLTEVCHAVQLPEHDFMEMVEYGIVVPLGDDPADWSFTMQMVGIARQACRLHRDLDLEWSAVALVVDLLEQRDKLQHENQMLKSRLDRFLADQ